MHDRFQRATASLVVFEVLLIFGTFFVYAGWPAPDVNEAHYLVKARHYWEPDWIPGDSFLDSSNAHLAFYWSVGWLSQLMSLTAFAWTVRAITWLLLAYSWQRLSWAVVPRPLYSVLSAALFVSLMDFAHQSGEWVVGGAEAKGFAYVFVFLALESLVRGRWNLAIALCGAGAAFHVIVGGWAGVCLGFAWLCEPGSRRPRLLGLLPGVAVGAVLSLPGLLPALQLTLNSDPEVVAQANWIYVTRRLGHHLDPIQFPAFRVARFLTMLAGGAVLWWLVRQQEPGEAARAANNRRERELLEKSQGLGDPVSGADWGRRRLAIAVLGSILLMVVGWIIGWGLTWQPDLRNGLLRYYWFRLADSFVPLGISLAACYLVAVGRPRHSALSGLLLSSALAGSGAIQGCVLWERQVDWLPRGDRHFRAAVPGKPEQVHSDWMNICELARHETPPDAKFITPRWSTTFHWYAHRPEVATWKNIPQDAQGIVDWWKRLVRLHHFSNQRFAIGALGGSGAAIASPGPANSRPLRSLSNLPVQSVIERGEAVGAQYLLTNRYPPLPLAMIGANRSFALYRLPPPPDDRATLERTSPEQAPDTMRQ